MPKCREVSGSFSNLPFQFASGRRINSTEVLTARQYSLYALRTFSGSKLSKQLIHVSRVLFSESFPMKRRKVNIQAVCSAQYRSWFFLSYAFIVA